MNWRFYEFRARDQDRDPRPPAQAGVPVEVWTPAWNRMIPPGQDFYPFVVWWLFQYSHLFANSEYRVAVIRQGRKVVHRSCIFPGYFRFPFMAPSDLQVGDTWTHPEFRGQGLAAQALRFICANVPARCDRVWYVVEEGNRSSIRAVEKAGFRLAGHGSRTTRFGLRLLGSFALQQGA